MKPAEVNNLANSLRRASRPADELLRKVKQRCASQPKLFAKRLLKYKREYASYAFPPDVKSILASRTGATAVDYLHFYIAYREIYRYMPWSFYLTLLRQLPANTSIRRALGAVRREYGIRNYRGGCIFAALTAICVGVGESAAAAGAAVAATAATVSTAVASSTVATAVVGAGISLGVDEAVSAIKGDD